MSTVKQKFQLVKKLLKSVRSSRQAREAEASIEQATRLMSEIETAMLSNPFLQVEELGWVVEFNRGPAWMVAKNRLDSLRKSA